jgi:hypothetical protein
MTLDSNVMKISVPKDNVVKISTESGLLSAKNKILARKLASFLGLLNATAIAIRPALLMQQYCQIELWKALKTPPNWAANVLVNEEMQTEFSWWQNSMTTQYI